MPRVKTKERLTSGQKIILSVLDAGPKTVAQVNKVLGFPWTYNRVHGTMRRLEDRDLVRRSQFGDRGTLWEMTVKGRKALDSE